MELGSNGINTRIQGLRQQKFEEREAAASKAQERAARGYGRIQTMVWSAVHVFFHCWLNIYAVVALLAGVVFVVLVPQAREIFANLAQEGQPQRLFLLSLAIWALSIWYTMRVLSTTDFPGDEEAHPAAKSVAAWLNAESPRLAPFAGLVVIACATGVFMRETPGLEWVPVLAAGVLPLTWAMAALGDRVVRLWRPLTPRPVYTRSTLGVALVALAVGGGVWWSVPEEIRGGAAAPRHAEEWLIYVCAALTFVPLFLKRRGALSQAAMAIAFALWVWAVVAAQGNHPGSLVPLQILVLAALGHWLTTRRREMLGIAEDPATPSSEVSSKTFSMLGVALALQLVLVIAFSREPIALGERLGTLPILFLALSVCAFFGIVWVFAPKYLTLPSFALVPLVWALPFGNAPDHSLRDVRFEGADERPPLAQHFAAWQAELPKERKDNPVFFVAAAGGGLRAAYWTAHVLAAADDATCGEFGRHVYAYSGVSGGSLGIAAYLAQRQVWQQKTQDERCQRGRADEMRRMLNRDFLAPVAGSLLFAEMTQRFSPYTYLADDRGSTLARSWARAWDDVFPGAQGRFDRPFLVQFKADSTTPAVFLNATSVESGQRAVAMNVRARISGALDLFRPVSGVNLKTHGLTVREAVLNSARFTYVSPAATVLGCKKSQCTEAEAFVWGRLVDGGYFENSGIATLMDLIDAMKPQEGAAAPGLRRSQIQVIVIDNAADNEPICRRRGASDPSGEESDQAELPASLPALSGVTAPLEAFLKVREARAGQEVRRARADYRCRSQLIDWDLFAPRGSSEQAQKAERQAEDARHEPALGWFLSRRSARAMSDAGSAVAAEFPFRHAVCDDGKLPKTVRVLVGSRSQTNVPCPSPGKV